jgi:uncharacterized glyoxalase superfamily protein PhnB
MTDTVARRQNVYPALRYRNALAAIRWIESAFGFASESVHPNADGTIAHAEIRCGADLVMVGSLPKEGEDRLTGPSGHASLYVAVDDTGRYFEGAKTAGATVVQAPHDTFYGSRGDCTVIDPEGHWWSFGTYRP